MKRITLLAVLVFLCAGAMVFADSATVAFTGAVEGGAKIVNDSTGTSIQQYTNNEGTVGWANLSVAATLGDMSANFYLRSSDFATWTIPNAWITEKLFNKMVEVRAGVIDNGVTGTANQGFGGIGGTGIQIVLVPMAGLSIGGLIPASLPPLPGNGDLYNTLGTFRVGAAYSLPNLANFAMSYLNTKEFDAGIDLKAVENLTAQLEAQIPLTTSPTYKIFEKVGYDMGAPAFSVSATESLPTFDLTVTPYVEYVMDITTIWAQVGYTMSTSKIAPEVGVSFAWNGMGTFKIVYDGSFASGANSHTINLNFIHSF